MGGVSKAGEQEQRAMKMRIKPRSGELAIVHEDELLRIAMTGNPDDPNVFLCFTGVGGGVGGVQVEEFVGTTRLPGYFALYITDKKRRWFNWDPEPALAALRPYVEGKSIVSIGNSMGGFGAIWITAELGSVRTCMAFAAQYSVHPEIVPNETRWADYRQGIGAWRTPSLLTSFSPATRFWTFNGEEDVEHWSKFPQGDNLTHLLVRNTDHDVARRLKEIGVLADVISDCVGGVDPSPRIEAAGLPVERIGADTTRAFPSLKRRGGSGGHRLEGQSADALAARRAGKRRGKALAKQADDTARQDRLKARDHDAGEQPRRARKMRRAAAAVSTAEALQKRTERKARRAARKRDDD